MKDNTKQTRRRTFTDVSWWKKVRINVISHSLITDCVSSPDSISNQRLKHERLGLFTHTAAALREYILQYYASDLMIFTILGAILLLKIKPLHPPTCWKSSDLDRLWYSSVFNKIPYETLLHKLSLSVWCIIHGSYLPSSIMQSESLTIHTQKKATKSVIIIMRAFESCHSFFMWETESLFVGHMGQHGRKWGTSDLF